MGTSLGIMHHKPSTHQDAEAVFYYPVIIGHLDEPEHTHIRLDYPELDYTAGKGSLKKTQKTQEHFHKYQNETQSC